MTQVRELDLLVGAPVQLPEAVLSRFQNETGWAVRVTPWDQSAAATGTAAGTWRNRLVLSYDAWILDSELLAGLAHVGALAPPWPLLDPMAFVEIQTASQPQVRRFGTSYRYLAAGLPVGTNTLVLYGNPAALRRLYDDEQMRRRLGLVSASAAGTAGNGSGGGDSSSSSGGGSGAGDLVVDEDGSDSEVQPPPVWSWEQLVDAVAAVNSTDFDGDGAVEYGICLEVAPGCLSSALVQGIAASYLQTHGSSDGVLIDPSTMAWRLDSSGFRSALWTLQRLLSYSAPPTTAHPASSSSPSCRRLSGAFAEGRCAFAIHSLSHLKAAYGWPGRDAAVVVGTRVMQLPGSVRVDRGGGYGVLEDCTTSSCPYASPLHGDAASSGGSGGWFSGWWSTTAATGSGGVVNVAPLLYGAPVGGINAATPAASKAAAASLLAFLASSEGQSMLAADMQSGVSSFRRLSPTAELAAAGMAAAAVAAQDASLLTSPPPPPPSPPSVSLSAWQLADLAALSARLWGHPNTAPTLRVPGVEALWPHFDAAVAELSPHSSTASVLHAPPPANLPYADDAPPEPLMPAVAAAQGLLGRELPAAFDAVLPSSAERRAEVQAAVAYQPPVLTQRAASPPPAPGPRIGLIVGLTVGLGGSVALLLVALVLWARRTLRRLRGTSSNGGGSSDRRSTATYVVLDIQGLSEPGIPDAVREHALRICHDVVKQLARRYDGSLVPLPQHGMPPPLHLVPPAAAAPHDGAVGGRMLVPSAAALRAALAAELTASALVDPQDPAAAAAAAVAAGTWGGRGAVGGDGGDDGGEESSAGARMRPGYWVYERSYLSLTSRDLDAPPPPLRPSTGVSPRALDEHTGMPVATTAVAAAAAAAAVTPNALSSNQERLAERDLLAAAAPPLLAALTVQTCSGATTLTTESSGRLSPLAGIRVTAHEATETTAFQLAAAAFPLNTSGANSPLASEMAGGLNGQAGGAEGHGASADPRNAASCGGGGGGAGSNRTRGVAVSASRLRIALDVVGCSPDPTVDSDASPRGGATAAVAVSAAEVTGSGTAHSGSGDSGGVGTSGAVGCDSSGGGGCGGGASAAHLLRVARQTGSPAATAAGPHRSSLQLHHAATASSTVFMAHCRASGGKEPLSAGHLSEMLLPLPATAAATAADAASGPAAPGTLASEPQQPQSPFAVYRTSSSEVPPRPWNELDGPAQPGGLGLAGYGPAAPLALPTLPEGGVADARGLACDPDRRAAAGERSALAPAGSSPPLASAGRGGGRGHAMSTPATPLLGLGRHYGLSPLPRPRPAPYTPLVGAAPSMWPSTSAPAPAAAPSASTPASRGGGALAVAMAAAKAAAGAATAPPAPLRTRLALVFSTVHDAVCFCVHMQAMLTNCRWSPEVLELPDCQSIAVRPRSLAAEGQQAAVGGGAAAVGTGGPAGGAADGAKAGTSSGRAAGTAGAGVAGPESGGGVVVASAQSSFIVSPSPSPFSPSGAVDRMKSLISGGVKGRSGRMLRPMPVSPRLAAHGASSLSGGAAAAGTAGGGGGYGPDRSGLGPDRSGLSVSRFAAASNGPASSGGGGGGGGGAIGGGPFASRSLMYASGGVLGAHGYDPWVGGTASSVAVSRSGSTTAWCAPHFSGSFGGGAVGLVAVHGSATAGAIGLQSGGGGGPSSGSHAPPRSPLGRMSRGGGGAGSGSPAQGSPFLGLPSGGTASLPLPKLLAAANAGPAVPVRPAARATAAAASPPPPPPRLGWPFAVRRVTSAAHDISAAAAAAVASGSSYGGGGPPLSDCADERHAAMISGGGGADASALRSGDSELAGGLPGHPERNVSGIVLGSLDSETVGEVGARRLSDLPTALSPVADVVAVGDPALASRALASAASMESSGATVDRPVGRFGLPTAGEPHPLDLSSDPSRGRRASYQAITVSQLPALHLQAAHPHGPTPASLALSQSHSHSQVHPQPMSLLLLQQQPNSTPLDSSSLVGSAATLVVGGFEANRANLTMATPASLPLSVGPDSDAPASFSLAGMVAAASYGGGSCEWPRGGGSGAATTGEPATELSLRLAATGLRGEPTLELPAAPRGALRPAAAADSYQVWVPPPLPSAGRPVAEAAEGDSHMVTTTVTGSSSTSREDCDRAPGPPAAAPVAAETAPSPPLPPAASVDIQSGVRQVTLAARASLGGYGTSGSGGGGGSSCRPGRLSHPHPDRSLASAVAGLVCAGGPAVASAAGTNSPAGSSPPASLPSPGLPQGPRRYQAGSPLLAPASRFQQQSQTHGSAASSGGGGIPNNAAHQPIGVAASVLAAQLSSGAAAGGAWTSAAALPPPPSTCDRAHASVPLMKINLDEQEITPQYSAVSTNLMRIRALHLPAAVQGTQYDNGAAAGASGGRSPGSGIGDGGGAGGSAASGGFPVVPEAAPPPRPAVRSFGEQVRMTFEPLVGVERSNPEAGITVIFRGPRVVCGISTWQYGDEDGGDEQYYRYGARRSGADGVDALVEDELYEMDELSPLVADGGPDILLSSPPPPASGAAAPPRGTSEAPLTLSERATPNFGVPPGLGLGMVASQHGGGSGDAARSGGAAEGDAYADSGADGGERPSYATRSNPLFNVTIDGIRYEQPPSCIGTPAAVTAGAAAAPATVGTAVAGTGLEETQLLDADGTAAAASAANDGAGVGEMVAPESSTRGGGGGGDAAGVAAGRSRGALLSPEARKQWRRRRMPAPLRRALAICESGQGGFVLLDGATYSASSQEALQEQCMILHMGEYLLAGVSPSLDLYLALDFAHLARLAHLQPLACAEQLSLGLPCAPVNAASICFCLVGGMQTLLAWNGEVAKAALGVLRDAVLPALLHHGGYLVEDADGLLLTAFPSSRSALAWALECQEEVKHLDWPDALLGHALGEAVYVDDEMAAGTEEEEEEADEEEEDGGCGCGGTSHNGADEATGARRHLVFRGLRIKCGLDCGDVLARVHATTGRMTYRGRVMNRAARIAGMATAGQVLCSRGLWDASGLAAAPDLCHQALAVGESLGEVQLKGLSAKMEVINCIRILRSEMAPLAPEAAAMEEGEGEQLPVPGGYPAHRQYAGQDAPAGREASRNGSARRGAAAANAAAAGDSSDGVPPPPHSYRHLGLPAFDGAPPILMQAVPLLSDSDSDGSVSGGVAAGGAGTANSGIASGDADGAQGSSSANALAGVARDRSLATVSVVAAAADWKQSPRAADASAAAAAAAASPDPDNIGRASVISRSSVTTAKPGDGQRATPTQAALSSMPPPLAVANTPASLAAALAAARLRRASQLRNSRFLHSGGAALDRAVVVGGGHVGNGGVQSALLLAEEDDDGIADRLVAGYSSDGSEDGGGDGGGSGSDGSDDGVAALHGMLRRQRPTGQPGAAATAAAAGGQGGGVAGAAAATGNANGTPKGQLASNFKKALRAVKRSLLEESGGGVGGLGSGSGSDGSGSDREGGQRPSGFSAFGPNGGGGSAVARLRRPPPRRQSELPKPTSMAAATAAGAGAGAGGRIFNRLRSLAANRGGRRRGGAAGGGFDDLEEEDESRFRPMGSANSEFFPSRNGSPMLSAARSRLRGGIVQYSGSQRSGSGAAVGVGGGSPLPVGSMTSGGAAADGAVNASFSRCSGGSSALAASRGGGGLFGRASSRLGGGSLVAEMSFASMTMRRHIPVTQLLGPGAAGGGGGGGNRSFPRLTFDTNPGGSSSVVTSTLTSPSGAPATSPSPSPSTAATAAPPPPLTASFKRTVSHLKGSLSLRADDMAYGILEDDGEAEADAEGDEAEGHSGDKDINSGSGNATAAADGGGGEAAASSWIAGLRSGSETRRPSFIARGGGGTLGGAAGSSLPARLASFTSSFLQRARSRRLLGGGQIPSGEVAVRPFSGGSERDGGGGGGGGGSRPTSGARSGGGGSDGAGGDGGSVRGRGGSSNGAMVPPRTSAGGSNAADASAGTSLRPMGRLMSRIESLRRKPAQPDAAMTPAATAGAPAPAPAPSHGEKGTDKDKRRRPSDSLASLVTFSLTGGSSPSSTAAAAAAAPPIRGPVPLGRSATGLGFTPLTEAPPGLEDRPRSSGQHGHGAPPPLRPSPAAAPAAAAATGAGAGAGAPHLRREGSSAATAAAAAGAVHSATSRRSVQALGSVTNLDTQGPHGGGGGMYGGGGSVYGSGGGHGGRTLGGLLASGSFPSGAAGGAAPMPPPPLASHGAAAGGAGSAAPAGPHAGDPSMGAGGSAWGGLFSSLHNFLGLTPQGGAAAGGATCPNSPRASTLMQPSSMVLHGGGAGGNGSVTGGRAGRRRSVMMPHPADDLPDGGAGAPAATAAPRNRRRSVIEISGNVLILNAGASYAAGGWPLAADSESNYCYAGGSTMLADASYGGGAAAAGGGPGAGADGDAMYGGAFDVGDLLDRRGFSSHLPSDVNGPSGLAAALAPTGDAPDSPRHLANLRRQSTMAGSSGSGATGGGSGVKAKPRPDAGDRTLTQLSRSFKSNGVGGGGGGGGSGADAAPACQPTLTPSAAAAVGAALHTARTRRASGPAAAAVTAGAAASGGGHEAESPSPAAGGLGLGRLVRGISGLVSRGGSTTRGGGGGGRHCSGSSRGISDTHRFPSVTAAGGGVSRSGCSVSIGQTGGTGLSAAAAAGTAAVRHASRGRSRGGGVGGGEGGSDSDALGLGQRARSPHTPRTAAATPSAVSANGEGPTAMAAPTAPASRYLVPELARSAKELVSKVIATRSTRSTGGAGGGGPGSCSDSGNGSGGGRAAAGLASGGAGRSPDRAPTSLREAVAQHMASTVTAQGEQARVSGRAESGAWSYKAEHEVEMQLRQQQRFAGVGGAARRRRRGEGEANGGGMEAGGGDDDEELGDDCAGDALFPLN